MAAILDTSAGSTVSRSGRLTTFSQYIMLWTTEMLLNLVTIAIDLA